MRTGAIFARGSCRALKWMALVGVVLMLGDGSAAAQVQPPGSVTLTPTAATTLTVAWNSPTSGDSVGGYQYRVYEDASPPADDSTWSADAPTITDGSTSATAGQVPGSTTVIAVSGLTAATVYRVQVRTVSTATTPTYSASRTSRAATAIDAPGAVTVDTDKTKGGDGMATLVWTAPTGAPITKYQYRYKKGATDFPATAKWMDVPGGRSARKVDVPNLENGTEYRFDLRAVAGSVAGPSLTAALTRTPAGLPGAPMDLQVERTAARMTEATLSWLPPDDDGGATILRYEHRRHDGDGRFTAWASAGDVLEVEIIGLSADMEYTFEVAAVNSSGRGAAASTAPEVAVPTGMPTVTAEAADGEVMLTWMPVAGATKYQYAYARTGSTMGDWMPRDGQSAMTATVDDLTNEMEYTFYVRAGNDAGYGDHGTATATPTAQRPTTSDGPTDADVKSISIGGEDERTIGGAKRLHLMEGERTELSITLDWSVQQLRDIYAADSTPSPVMVYFEVMEKYDGADWLSRIDLTGDDRDVLDARDAVSVKIPTKPSGSANANARVSSAPGKVRFAILEDDDAEDEAFTIAVLASESRGVSTRSTSGNKLMTGTYVIDDDETQGLNIKRTSKGTIYETGDDQEFEITADPELVDLSLDIRLDLTNADDSAVSRAYGVSPTSGTIASGGKIEATVDVDNNDGNRMDDDLELHAEIVSRNRDDIEAASLEFTVLDVHKLPHLTVDPASDTVAEGGEIELTLTLDRNPRNTRAVDPEAREYTSEAIDVMVDTLPEGIEITPRPVKFPKHNGKAPWTQEMKVEVTAKPNDDLDGERMVALTFEAAGTMAENGMGSGDGDEHMAVATLTIEDGTDKLVWARSPEEVEAAVMAAKKAGMGDDMTFTEGEMIELKGNDLFGTAEGVTAGYTAMVEGDAVSYSESGGVVTITADSMGMAKVTITARASRPSGAVVINDQTDPREASITIALEVGLVALSIELSGPEEMNIVEGGMGGMVTATANRAVTEATVVNLMRDRAMSSAADADFTAEPITIMAGQMKGSTMVMAVEDNMMENDDNMAEELVLYGMAADNAGEVTGHVKFYIWDAAVPALPVIAQLLLAAFLAVRRLPPLPPAVAFGGGVRDSPLPPLPQPPAGGRGRFHCALTRREGHGELVAPPPQSPAGGSSCWAVGPAGRHYSRGGCGHQETPQKPGPDHHGATANPAGSPANYSSIARRRRRPRWSSSSFSWIEFSMPPRVDSTIRQMPNTVPTAARSRVWRPSSKRPRRRSASRGRS